MIAEAANVSRHVVCRVKEGPVKEDPVKAEAMLTESGSSAPL